jgi:transcription antitermination factor NusG
MQDIQGKLLTEIKTSRFAPDEIVNLLEGPFKGFEGTVIGIYGDVIKVSVDAKILGKSVEMAFCESALEHKSRLQNIEVQDI